MAGSPVYMLRMLLLAGLACLAAAESHHLRKPNNRAQARSHRAFRAQPVYPYRYEDVSGAAPSGPTAGQPPAERRTFVSVLLAAEIAYLEGVLASSVHSRLKAQREKARRPGRGAGQHPVHHSAPAHHSAPPPRLPYAAREVPVTEKYVSQLDPFFMLDAPDLSAGGPGQTYDGAPSPPAHPTTGRTSRSNQRIEAAEPVLSVLPAPRPTYGAFPLYNRKDRKASAPEIVTAAPAALAATRAAEAGPAKPTKRLVRGHSKGNWGDFELYHPGGYLPPKKPVAVAKKYKAAKEPAPTKASTQLYRATAAPVKAAPAKEYKPVVKEYKPVAVPSKAYKPATKSAPKPAPKPASKPAPKPTRKPATKPTRKPGTKPTRKPATKPTRKPTPKPTPKPAPKPAPSTIYKTSPTIQDVQVLYKTAPTVAYKKPSPSQAPVQPHPHTFFHDDQAKQVHKGDWPPIYYNSIHKQQRAALKVARRV